ncbi:DUF421 domain-containing protein [Tahibacter soli]|uniref:DUF421 domain-containing protein n=1 Tax=Tahibacter soli TaxID=2983605 RepID=A0A9X3YP76_9GAMM|nr:YetF domain-containing protein [Tahibacter soli]MDC8014403.1 DUF421 domain-containing protein [Tahibacter soli]
MFSLSLPWWEFMARGAIVYVCILFLVRLSGKRTVGEFTPFDLVVVILIGESTQGAMTGGDESVLGAPIVAATLIALNMALGFLSARSKTVDRLLEGEPVLLVREGTVLQRALRANNLPPSDLEEAVRKAGLSSVEDVALGVLETNGEITIVPKTRQA